MNTSELIARDGATDTYQWMKTYRFYAMGYVWFEQWIMPWEGKLMREEFGRVWAGERA